MKKTFSILLLLFVLIGCGEQQKSLSDYESYHVKIAREKFEANNDEFTMLFPKGWFINEDPIDSDTVLYVMEGGTKDTNFVGFGIAKMNAIHGKTNDEFDKLLNKMTDRFSNVELIERSEMKIGNKNAQTALLTYYDLDQNALQEEIIIFVPLNDTQYYQMVLGCDRNEKTQHHLGLMIDCAKTFQLNK